MRQLLFSWVPKTALKSPITDQGSGERISESLLTNSRRVIVEVEAKTKVILQKRESCFVERVISWEEKRTGKSISKKEAISL